MQFLRDRRKRAVALLGVGVTLIFVVLGWMQAFNTSNISFLNPETAGETLAFTALTVLVFLLLLTLLMLLLRNILKLYAGQSSSALGSRLRTRMVLGAVLIALTPAVFMFLFSFQLMNRSLDRWFSPNTLPIFQLVVTISRPSKLRNWNITIATITFTIATRFQRCLNLQVIFLKVY